MRPVPLLVLLGCLQLVKEKKTHNLNATHAFLPESVVATSFLGKDAGEGRILLKDE